jgi:hypothetical protein
MGGTDGVRGVVLVTFAVAVSGWLMPHPGCCVSGRELSWMDMEKGKFFLSLPEFEL